MAPRTTDQVDGRRHTGFTTRPLFDAQGRIQSPVVARTWKTWVPDDCPDLTGVLWDDAPWRQRVDHTSFEVDEERTVRWHRLEGDDQVRTKVGEVSDQNVHGGVPWQDVSMVTRLTTVYDEHGAQHRLPLPETVRMLGDPTGIAGDRQWFGVDPVRRLLYEASALGRRVTVRGVQWVAQSVHIWNLDKPWNQSAAGVTGTNLPMLAGIATFDELVDDTIDHALWYVATAYSPAIVAPARSTDPVDLLTIGHPLRAGERLWLDPDWRPARPLMLFEWIQVRAMQPGGHGLIVADLTHHEQPAIRQAMDGRVDIGDLGITVGDLRIIRPREGASS